MTAENAVKKRSRARNSARNTLFAAIAYVTKMLLQFVVRAVFIRYFVASYLGVNGLFTNILHFLSLAELGVGQAIVYSMYKPIAENDTEKIKSLVRLYRNLYLIIAGVVITVGLALIPALPYLIKDSHNIDLNLTVVYVIYLSRTVVGYFFAYRRSLVFAYQRNDIESKVSFLAQFLLSGAELLIIVLWQNFYAYIAVSFIFYAFDALIVFIVSYRLFPEIRGKAKKLEKEDAKTIAKNTGAMVFHKIGSAVVFSTDNIIISAFLGAVVGGHYSNYMLITTSLTSVLNLVVTAVKSSVGNLIVTKKPEQVYKIFNALHLMMMWMISFMFIGLMVCFQDFIRLYTGKPEYVLEYSTVVCICVSWFLSRSRNMANTFKDCAGLFWNDRFKPLFEAGLNLGLDFLLVQFMGINGVILATIISTVAAPLWVEPFVLYKHYFKKPLWHYFLRYAIYVAIAAVALGETWGICYFIPSGRWWWFILKFCICLVLPNLIFLIFYILTPEFGYLTKVAKKLLRRKKRKKAAATEGAPLQSGPVVGDVEMQNADALDAESAGMQDIDISDALDVENADVVADETLEAGEQSS